MSYEKNNRWVKHIDFVIIDLLCMEISLLAAHMISHGIRYPFTAGVGYGRLALITAILLVCYIFFAEPYSGILRRGYLQELKSVIVNNVGLLAVIVVILYAIHISGFYSRIMMASFIGLNIVLTYICHVIRKKWLGKRANVSSKGRALILATHLKDVNKCVEKLLKNPYGEIKLEGIILLDDLIKKNQEAPKIVEGIPVVGNDSSLLDYCRLNVVDDLLFYNAALSLKRYRDTLLNMGIRVHRNMVNFDDSYLHYQVSSVNGIMTLSACITPTALWQRAAKRFLDILGGLVGCICTGLIFLFVAPIIKIQAPGPVFFSQTRIGRNGRKFKIYKFRSMYVDAEERKKELMAQNKMSGFMFKVDNDPRIFPFGHIIRKTSLDEFPQFWNVLKGDMSLCGTRPPTLDEYIQYEPHHKSRLAMKPGITGMWQVSGRSQITDFEEVVRLDNEYIRNWSLGLDIKILFKTVLVVFQRQGSE